MLRKELTQVTSDLTAIIDAVKQYKESPNDYEAHLMTPRLGKRNFMDICDELRAKQGRLTVYANKEKRNIDISADDIKEDIVKAIKILQEDVTAVKSAANINEEIKKQCHNVLLKLDKIAAMNELKNSDGDKPAP